METNSYDVLSTLYRQPMSLRHEPDVSHADWFVNSGDDWRQLCSIGPSGFPAYARILHPLDDDIEDMASRLLCEEGDVDDAQLEMWCGVLARHTTTSDDCFFGLWEGFGEIHGGLVHGVSPAHGSTSWREPPAFDDAITDGPRVAIPARKYLLFRGPLDEAGEWPSRQRINSPNLIWPEDRAWFVASEIDLPWTGVGGSVQLIEELLAHDLLDVVPAAPGPDLPYWREGSPGRHTN